MFQNQNRKQRASRGNKSRRRRRTTNNQNSSVGYVVRSVKQIVPDRFRTTLAYTALVSFSASPTAGNVFVGNSMFDPEFAIGGQQPVGFDELSALYLRYRVFGSKIRVRFAFAVASTTPTLCVIYPTTDSTTVASARLGSEQPYAKDLVVMGSNPTRITLVNSISTDVIAGEPVEKVIYDDVFSSQFNASPLSPWYWIVTATATDGATNISGTFVVEIHYDAEFYRRNVLPQS